MRVIDHVVAGGQTATDAASTRQGDVFDPNSGQVQARVPLGDAALLDRAVAAAQGRNPPGPQPIRSAGRV
jgi:malonate-semialdehyde dehydrogenase (acetylating)/methylmalonate-semialdehyde dehydrogenase